MCGTLAGNTRTPGEVTRLEYTAEQGGNEPTLCNADNGTPGNGGVGATLTIPGTLAANGTINPDLQIGLPMRALYRVFVDLFGFDTNVVAANVNATQTAIP